MYVGCDVGKEGAIVEVTKEGRIMSQWVMPLREVKTKKKGKKTPDSIIDLDSLCELLSRFKGSKMVIEEVHAIYGSAAGSTFGLAESFMALKMGATCIGLEWSLSPPKLWQKIIWIPSDIVTTLSKSGKMVTDTKATSLNAAMRLFPGHSFIQGNNEEFSSRKKKFNDGLIDASLIALYAKYYYENK